MKPILGMESKLSAISSSHGTLKTPNKTTCWPKCLMLNSNLGNCRLPTQIPPSVSIRGSIHFLPDTYSMPLASKGCHIPAQRRQHFGGGCCTALCISTKCFCFSGLQMALECSVTEGGT